MTRKCLGCGNVSGNNLYACSSCLNKINEARRDVELKKGYTKETILRSYKIFAAFSALSTLIIFVYSFVTLNKLGFLASTKALNFFYGPSTVALLIYFLLGALLFRSTSIQALRCYSDENYYLKRPIDRIKDFKILKPVLLSLALWLSVWVLASFSVIAVQVFFNVMLKVRVTEPLLRLQSSVVRGFGLAGFFLGMIWASCKYFDWVKGLER